jgi:hypothetical protein
VPDQTITSTKRVLDPIDRTSEILFGLIMALTFTCSLSVAQAGQAEVRTMLLGALGCNLAWGIIDGVFYLMGALAGKGRGLKTLQKVRVSTDAHAARQLIAAALPAPVAGVLQPEELEQTRRRLVMLPEPPAYAQVTRDESLGAVAAAILVFFSTFPAVIPFLLVADATQALRLSNAVATVMLFVAGYRFGISSGRPP